MDSKTRKAALARDAGVLRIRKTTRLIGACAVAGGVVMAAGFAHLLPTHLPQVNVGHESGDGGTGGSSSNGSSGLQGPNTAPGGGSGSSQVTSGGS
jgi:hypothetical protein